jgi:hypothetical protein
MTELKEYKKTLEVVIRQRDEALAEVERLRGELEKVIKERDEARAEVEIWKGVVGKQSMKISAMEARPEPSRLEIAADLLCVWEGRAEITNVDTACKDALSIADKLIAADKEEVGK